MPVNGKNAWVWTAVTNQSAFITVEYSRGENVLEKHFREFGGVAVVDGWRAYGIFEKRQRCWAHILREANTVSLRTKDAGAEKIASSLRLLYHDIKSELQDHPPPDRSLYMRSWYRFRKIIRKRYRNDDVKKFVAKLENAGKSIFTFILYNDIEPTNNAAERMLREVVVHRKIRGQLRTEKGMSMFENIMTCMMTWKMRGLNPLEEVAKYL